MLRAFFLLTLGEWTLEAVVAAVAENCLHLMLAAIHLQPNGLEVVVAAAEPQPGRLGEAHAAGEF